MTDNRRLTTIEISKEDIKFSAAHFTVFSATERERLHGHNYFVSVEFSAPVSDSGMCFSYREIKLRLRELCAGLDEYMLLPRDCSHLQILDEPPFYRVLYNGETMYFLQSDTRLLPVRNITLEELSAWLLDQLLLDQQFAGEARLARVRLKVSSGAGQWGSTDWPADQTWPRE